MKHTRVQEKNVLAGDNEDLTDMRNCGPRLPEVKIFMSDSN